MPHVRGEEASKGKRMYSGDLQALFIIDDFFIVYVFVNSSTNCIEVS